VYFHLSLAHTLLSVLGLGYCSTARVSMVFAAQAIAVYPDCSLAPLAVRNRVRLTSCLVKT
jgi:hypothetical protein